MNDRFISFCNKGIMSVCVACKNKEIQRKCFYFNQASRERRCMDLKFKEYCGSLDAQKNIYGAEIITLEDFKERYPDAGG
ncbi:hypothetical protein KAJ89_00635 [Candidatus Parcubacteria bacterium]|nr:hypothetical protein [Candidatus Parcubacteria bacterium]